MKIVDFFEEDNREHWIEALTQCDWGAGRYLARLLREDKLKGLVGKTTKVLMLVEGDELISFCTFAEKDDIQPTELTPWIGWVYTYPQHRGNHYAGRLLSYAWELAKAQNQDSIYISTNTEGLYEKYGYEFYGIMKDIDGEDSRVYVRKK